MKKSLSLLSAILMACTAIPMSTAAVSSDYDMNLDGVVNSADAFALAVYVNPQINEVYSSEGETYIDFTDEMAAYIAENGDYNGDGVVDSLDSSMLSDDIFNENYDNLSLDFDCNGSITVDDANILVKYYGAVQTGMLETTDKFTAEQRAQIEAYGDIDGNTRIESADSSLFLMNYFDKFEMGDVTLDGSVDSADASLILRYYSDYQTNSGMLADKSQEQTVLTITGMGDFDNDGIVDSSDASAILSAYVDQQTNTD